MDTKKIEKAVFMILEAIGEDPLREGLKETPQRVARMYEEVFEGIGKTAKEHLEKVFSSEGDNLVIEKNIGFYSMCEHHLLPFIGEAHIAYVPNGKIAGLSKLARTVDVYSKKPQVQERFTREVADALMTYLKPKGVIVIIEAEHLCMSMRGVKKPGTLTRTAIYRGIFEDYQKREEALQLMNI